MHVVVSDRLCVNPRPRHMTHCTAVLSTSCAVTRASFSEKTFDNLAISFQNLDKKKTKT